MAVRQCCVNSVDIEKPLIKGGEKRQVDAMGELQREEAKNRKTPNAVDFVVPR